MAHIVTPDGEAAELPTEPGALIAHIAARPALVAKLGPQVVGALKGLAAEMRLERNSRERRERLLQPKQAAELIMQQVSAFVGAVESTVAVEAGRLLRRVSEDAGVDLAQKNCGAALSIEQSLRAWGQEVLNAVKAAAEKATNEAELMAAGDVAESSVDGVGADCADTRAAATEPGAAAQV